MYSYVLELYNIYEWKPCKINYEILLFAMSIIIVCNYMNYRRYNSTQSVNM